MVGIIICTLLALMMFRTTWFILFKIAQAAVLVVRLVLVIALLTAATNNAYVYRAVGWTPMSLIFGPHMYNSSLAYLNRVEHRRHQH